ncbi:hypothetical protein V2I78_05520 [Pseudomonas viridiflava]|uniref:hypothetical protein n=1 Tax=Pseudomonas viridiflava TaxID=33069 RepID=UPI002EBD95C8|nr:hypothetical protein [Pseudomonas viridiflava]
MLKLTALPLLVLPLFALADCKDQLDDWARTVKPDLKFDRERAACKINPADGSQTLVALPFAENVTEDGDGDYGLAVIVADTASNEVIALHYQTAFITSDAIRFDALTLDTARYQLAPKLRAFGVRGAHRGSSRVNPYSSNSLNLYLLEGSTLRRVMTRLEVSAFGGEWDGMCVGELSQTERTLFVTDKGRTSLASLQIDEKTVGTKNELKGDDCEGADTTVTSRTIIKYDQGHYAVPSGMSSIQ